MLRPGGAVTRLRRLAAWQGVVLLLQHGVEAGRCSAALALVWLRALPNTALSWPRPVQNSPGNTRPGAQPVQNSPSNTPPAPQPVQNSPSTHKISKIQPFWTCRANFLSLIHHLGDDFRAADRHRLTVVHHRAHVAFCFFGPVSCTLKVASHGVPLQGAYTGLIRANSVHPVSTIKFPPTTTHAQIPTHPSTGQVPSGKLCTGLFGELERHTESAHS